MEPDDVTVVSVKRREGERSFVARNHGGSPPMDPGAWRGPLDRDELIVELKRLGLSDEGVAAKLAEAKAFVTTVTERDATEREMQLLHRLTGR